MRKLKRRVEDLEMHLKISQKFGKEREKQVEELNKKLNECVQSVNAVLFLLFFIIYYLFSRSRY